jgi:hypothetical protein
MNGKKLPALGNSQREPKPFTTEGTEEDKPSNKGFTADLRGSEDQQVMTILLE